jgi:phage/plasmid-like protein (TIGR03299 family)
MLNQQRILCSAIVFVSSTVLKEYKKMAHQIDFETGMAAFSFAGSPAWHRLGQPMTPEQQKNVQLAMQHSRTDFLVEGIKLYGQMKDGTVIPFDEWKGIIRTDSKFPLSVVGDGYQEIQQSETFELAQYLIDLGCRINVMGSIKHGRQVWALMSMPNAALDINGDPVDGFMCIRNAHDRSAALTAFATAVRIVCANTMELAEASSKRTYVSIRHTKGAKELLRVAKDTLEQMMTAMHESGKTFKQMASTEYDTAQIRNIIQAALPSTDSDVSKKLQERRITVAELIFHGKGQGQFADIGRGMATGWAILNGFTEYFDHHRVREAKRESAKASALHSALFGANNQTKNYVMALLKKPHKEINQLVTV